MFGIGETELVLILLFSFLVFGPDKLPGMGRTLGRALRQFRSAQEGFNKVVQSDLLDPAADVLNEKPKRSEKLRSAASDDSDIDSTAPQQETFAERRARLKAEREAALKDEAAQKDTESEKDDSAQKGIETQTDGASEKDADIKEGPAPETAASASSVATAEETKEKKTNSARDLYNLGNQRSSRAQKDEQKNAAKESETTSVSASSADSSSTGSTASESGEEDEGKE